MKKNALLVVGFLGATVAGLRLFSFVPLFGGLSFLALPSAIILLLATVAGAIAVFVAQVTARTYSAVTVGVLALLTVYGMYLRYEGDRVGSVGVYHESRIEHPVAARLREPVFLDSANYIGYDRTMFDTVQPWCRVPCVVFERLDWYRRYTSEAPQHVLEDIGVKPINADEARIKVIIKNAEHEDRVEIDAKVIDGNTATAQLTARVPSTRRHSHSPFPMWIHYALENNPIVLAVMPARRYMEQGLLKSFFASAIVLHKEKAAPVFDIVATEVASEVLSPPLQVDRSDPNYLKWWFRSSDERCKGVVTTEQRRGIAEKYVTFEKRAASAPHLRLIGSEYLICAGDAVYVHRYGKVPTNILDFSRYNLNGEHTADLHIRFPTQAVTTFIAFGTESVSEREGRMGLTVRNVRFKWAEDPIRKTNGEMLEYAIIDRVGEYQAVLPALSMVAQ